MKTVFMVLLGYSWIIARKAKELPSGWLHYELKDGTIGLMRPGKWKYK